MGVMLVFEWFYGEVSRGYLIIIICIELLENLVGEMFLFGLVLLMVLGK